MRTVLGNAERHDEGEGEGEGVRDVAGAEEIREDRLAREPGEPAQEGEEADGTVVLRDARLARGLVVGFAHSGHSGLTPGGAVC